MVDAAPTFPEVLKKLEEWMDSHGLRQLEDGEVVEGLVNAVWVTDGVSYFSLGKRHSPKLQTTHTLSHGTCGEFQQVTNMA